MDNVPLLPPCSQRKVSLTVTHGSGELSFLEVNKDAVHPNISSHESWKHGRNLDGSFTKDAPSQAETDAPGQFQAVLLLRNLPKNGGAYTFGRPTSKITPDVSIQNQVISRRLFCVFPDLRNRTWILQNLSKTRPLLVNGHQLERRIGNDPSSRIALEYDCLSPIALAQGKHAGDVVVNIKPTWFDGSDWLRKWRWQDPNLPELELLNLDWTFTSTLVTSAALPSHKVAAAAKAKGYGLPTINEDALPTVKKNSPDLIVILDRTFCKDSSLFYAQDLNRGTLLVAERFSSKSEAEKQVNLRKWLTEQAPIRSILIPTLAPKSIHVVAGKAYLLCPYPFDTDSLSGELLTNLQLLYNAGVAGVPISPTKIRISSLSPENPQIWMTGISSAQFNLDEYDLRKQHYTDVKDALDLIQKNCPDSQPFSDPIANNIFSKLLQDLQFKNLSAKESLMRFDPLLGEGAKIPFSSAYLHTIFPLKEIEYCGEIYYRKAEIVCIALAIFCRNTENACNARQAISCAKASKIVPGYKKELLSLEQIHSLFSNFGKPFSFHVEKLDTIKKRRREKNEERIEDFRVKMEISYHSPSGRWNISQLLHGLNPQNSLELADLCEGVEVAGDSDYEGIYVDANRFQAVCSKLNVSGFFELPEVVDSTADMFDGIMGQRRHVAIADNALIGTAFFDRSLRMMEYIGVNYTEAGIHKTFPPDVFRDVHRAISYPISSLTRLTLSYRDEQKMDFATRGEEESLPDVDDDSEDSQCTIKEPSRRPKIQETRAQMTDTWLSETPPKRRRFNANEIDSQFIAAQQVYISVDEENDRASRYSFRSNPTTISMSRYSLHHFNITLPLTIKAANRSVQLPRKKTKVTYEAMLLMRMWIFSRNVGDP
ncbi:hypothetical protein LOZ53_006265 [Ophidiomyces ophidiicola]|nr:hypothetical protein LOZ53_006265 [Ophidiomyces ophidiicola]